jgi:hypothetical protein
MANLHRTRHDTDAVPQDVRPLYHRITDGMKIAPENGGFDLTKVGGTSSVRWIAQRNEVK